MINFEFLDSLYRAKTEAEIELEKLREEKRPEPTMMKEILDIKIKNARENVNRLSIIIKSYISHHNQA